MTSKKSDIFYFLFLAAIAAVIYFLLGGCANVHYKRYVELEDAVDPVVEEFTYTRLGMQKITGFDFRKANNNAMSVGFNKQEGDAGDLVTLLKNISELMLKATTPTPVP